MNPAYTTARLRAELPHGALPAAFGVVTAWNPDGQPASRAANEAAHERLLSSIGHHLSAFAPPPFPVTGGNADFSHAEPGCGIVASKTDCLALGREFRQEAIFWIERGEVHLVSCADGSSQPHGAWRDRADGPAARPAFHFLGNLSLLDRAPQPFQRSSRCTGQQVLEDYAWARRQCDEGGTVISGFHSPVERDVFQILARRSANIIWVPGRDLPKVIPAPERRLLEAGRLLIASPFDYGKPSRPTRESCLRRNEWVMECCTKPQYVLEYSLPGTVAK